MSQIIWEVEEEEDQRRQEERDMQIALQRSLEASYSQQAGPSRQATQNGAMQAGTSSGTRSLEDLDSEIEDIAAQVGRLEELLMTLRAEREDVLKSLRGDDVRSKPKGKGRDVGDINYDSEQFEWSDPLMMKLKTVFGFDSFRVCQEGICNASMDRRDIVAIMPTGGGKSLGYQLPALMVAGCTIVISPLLALISDQIMHLREAGISAVMLTSSTSKQETNNIYSKLKDMAFGKSDASDIKLCYVTPEKVAQSKTFKTALDKLYRANRIARFVIDEAHCVSSMGHDFRPDYQKLGILREHFPSVPILALSATCPPLVLKDLLSTLKMPALTPGQTANANGTVLFSTTLYRKNLHYKVLPKPNDSKGSMEAMKDYIVNHHRDDTGIIYCHSKKDTEKVAEELHNLSGGVIRIGVYHADVPDAQKEMLHRRWRDGKVKVVCATIAFGMGIDKGDVRFVIHHTLSKSLDGFYQESGRAGRDGKDADCVLYYRPQDAFKIATLTWDERGGQEKALAMIAFASDLDECRKIQFANYFNKSSKVSLASWGPNKEDVLTRCGHCDNCTRAPDALERLGPRGRVAAWRVLRVAQAAARDLTMTQLYDLARGKDAPPPPGKGRGRGKARVQDPTSVDVDDVAEGANDLSKDQTEALCIRLLVDGYLRLSLRQTAHAVNAYLQPTALAERLTRLARADVEAGKGPPLELAFPKRAGASRRKSTGGAASGAGAGKKKGAGATQTTLTDATPARTQAASGSASASVSRKRKRRSPVTPSSPEPGGADDLARFADADEQGASGAEDGDVGGDGYESLDGFIVPDEGEGEDVDDIDDIEDYDDDDGDDSEMEWQTSLRGGTRAAGAAKGKAREAPPAKRTRVDPAGPAHRRVALGGSSGSRVSSDDVIEISSD